MAIDETQPPDARQPDDLESGTLASDFYAPGSSSPEEGSENAPPMTAGTGGGNAPRGADRGQ